MRRIIKGLEPEELRRWKEQNAHVPQNLTYANMPKAEVKRQMLAEQGYLCAYTMQQIPTPNDCQIEHLVPQSQGDPRLGITYDNLLACAPSNRPGHRPERGKCPFGAEQKDQTRINDDNFVSPLRGDVEQRFRYAADGSVTWVGGDTAAESTIGILRLDHQQLEDLRKAAIDERVFPPDAVLSSQEAENLSHAIMTPNAAGRLPEFCLAISQVAGWYANRVGEGN
jgi:uncharacterized protein (TIGR02646 family)